MKVELRAMNSSKTMTNARDVLIFKGRDRAKTLHNLCTNDILRASVGDCLEAFITSLQGKVLGFVELLVFEDSIYVISNEKGLGLCRDHIKKYSVFDETEVIEPEYEMQSLFINQNQGIDQISLLLDIKLESEISKCKKYQISQHDIILKPSFLGGSIELIGKREIIFDILENSKLTRFTPEEFELLRILAGWPNSGIDTCADNLPQEIDRDKTAISFKKGCYLGQEIVARLDALGHVNRKLVGVSFKPSQEFLNIEKVLPIQVLNKDNQVVGEIRSLAFDQVNQHYSGLAMMRLKALESEIRLAASPDMILKFQSLEALREGAASLSQSFLND